MFKLSILVLLLLFSGTILAQQEEELAYCTISEESIISTETDNLSITLNGIGEIILTTFDVATGTVSSNVNLRVSPSTSALVASVLGFLLIWSTT
jgi:hypothetical protein